MQEGSEIPIHVPAERVVRFDFRNDPAVLSDPWFVMDALNDAPDIFWSPDLGGYWVIARNELVDEFPQRHDLFSMKKLSVPPVPGAPPLIPNSLDPPEHGPYRRIFMQKMFSPRILAGLEHLSAPARICAPDTYSRESSCG